MEAAALIGRRLGEFQLADKIGEGGFGAVYRARQDTLERDAVVKILHPRFRTDPQIVARFMREARLAARLDHPYAAHVYAYGAEPDGVLWIAMELVRGTPLSQVLRAQGPVPLGRLVPFLDCLCEVVHSAHEQGIIHRDIKPANVMVLARGGRFLPKLLDLGVAKLLEDVTAAAPAARAVRLPPAPVATLPPDELTLTGDELGRGTEDLGETPPATTPPSPSTQVSGLIGSPLYMAPEIWRGEPADARADIYALGVLAYECLTGRPPFRGHIVEAIALAHLESAPPDLPADFPPALNEALHRALAKDRAARPASALELAAAFRLATQSSTEAEALPRLPDDLVAEWKQQAPRPLAEAVLLLDGARNAHQARDALHGLLRTLVRYVGVLALSCRARREPRAGDPQAATALLGELRRGRLDDAGWLRLATELTRRYERQPDAHPLPELVVALTERREPDPLAGLLAEVAAARGQVMTDSALDLLARALPRLAAELRRFAFLGLYPLVVGREGGAEVWRGPRTIGAGPLLRARVAPGAPAVVDAQGELVASLRPFAQVAAPAPGLPEELFLLAGRGRGGALLEAAPHGFERHDDLLWAELRGVLLDVDDEGPAESEEEQAPYRGLRAFTLEDAAGFLGREQEVVQFVNRLRVQPTLFVVGPSGAGKSSFVQAGAMAALPRGWRPLIFRPGPSPLAALAARVAPAGAAALRAELLANPEALVAHQPASETTVLVVDQLEEIFTLCADAGERQAFAAALAAAGASAELPVRVVATLRDDFLVRLEQLRGLRERVSHSLHLIATPAPEDLRRIVTEPAQRAGYEFDDPALPGEMVAAVADDPSALVLLSFTASRLWERRDRHLRRLTRRAYEELGGVGGALAHHAEEVLAGLPVAERPLVREVFRHLVTGEGTRAVQTRRDLLALLGGGPDGLRPSGGGAQRSPLDRPRGDAVLDRLVEARLLAVAQAETGEDRVEVIHEALLVAWPRLLGWRQEDAAGTRLHDQLRSAARQWDERGRARGLLWRDDALAEYRLWRTRHAPRLTELEEAFAAAGLAEAARGRRARIGGLAGAFLILAAVVVVLLALTSRARREREEAERARRAEARTVAWQYEEQGRAALLGGDPFAALAYLSEAWRRGVDTRAMQLMLNKAAQALDKQVMVLPGHAAGVTGVAFADDGARFVTASSDGDTRVWEAATGKLLLRLAAPPAPRAFALFSPDGARLATFSRFGAARLWDARTGAELAALGDGKVVMSPDGALALSYGAEGHADLWRLADGARVGRLAGHQGTVNLAAFAGGTVVTGATDGTLRVWRLPDGKPLATFDEGVEILCGDVAPGGGLVALGRADGNFAVRRLPDGQVAAIQHAHRRGVYRLEISPDGRHLVTTGFDSSARLFETATGRFVQSLDVPGVEIGQAHFSPDGGRVATLGSDRTIGIWSVGSGKLLSRLVGHTETANEARFAPDGARLVSGAVDRTVRVWEPRPDDLVVSLAVPGPIVYAAGFLPGERLFTSAGDGTLRVWDRAGAQIGAQRTGAAGGEPYDAHAVAVSPDGAVVAAASGAAVELRRLGGGELVATLPGHEGKVWSVAWSDDGAALVTTDDRGARVWDAAGRPRRAFPHDVPVYAAGFSPDGRRLVTGAADGAARVFPVDGDGATVVLRGHSDDLASAVFSPDGARVITASSDKSVRVWDAATGSLVESLLGHKAVVRSARMSPDGAWIVSASDDHTVKLWDVATGKLVYSYDLHGGGVWQATFSTDGHRLISASEDGTAAVWSVDERQRSAADIARLSACRVPFDIDAGRLVSRARPGTCP